MSTNWEAHHLIDEIGQPRRAFRHSQAMDGNAPPDRLRPHCLVRPRREVLTSHIGTLFPHGAHQERPNASANLPGLLGPSRWLPTLYQIAERLNPDVGRGLSTPQVEQPKITFGVNTNHAVDSIVSPITCDCIVRRAIYFEAGPWWHGRDADDPLTPEVIAGLRCRALLVKRAPGPRVALGLDPLGVSEPLGPQWLAQSAAKGIVLLRLHRQPQHVPVLTAGAHVLHHPAAEVVFSPSGHDQDNAAIRLQARQEIRPPPFPVAL